MTPRAPMPTADLARANRPACGLSLLGRAALAVLAIFPAAPVTGSTHDLPVRANVVLYQTRAGGPTSGVSSLRAEFAQGGQSRQAVLGLRVFGDGADSCGGYAQGTPRADLDRGLEWHLELSVADRSAGGAELEIVTELRSEGLEPAVARSREHRIGLSFGESRLLDHVQLGGNPSPCGLDAVHVEVELLPWPHPALADRPLVYEVWFSRTVDGRREEFAATEQIVEQGEEAVFRLRPLVEILELDGTTSSTFELETTCSGRLRAWAVGPDRVAIQAEPGVGLRVREGGSVGGFSMSSGHGREVFEAGLGETVELRMPEPAGRVTTSWAGGAPPDEPAAGVAFGDGSVSLDFARLLRASGYSLSIRVRALD